uniref:Uncharacterized protein n=1 Tax=Lotus japonicus TaxID=34305 RepID=I3SID1_LOTJA|nr:unknown [Lotus japonicus]
MFFSPSSLSELITLSVVLCPGILLSISSAFHSMFHVVDVEDPSLMRIGERTTFRIKPSETPLNCRTISSTASSTLTAKVFITEEDFPKE